MKRMMPFIALFLITITLSACSTDKTVTKPAASETNQRKNVVETDPETGETYYLLGDFENYYECTQANYVASFGKVTEISKNAEPDMVPYGNQSVKLEISGTEESWRLRRPTMRFFNGSGFFDKTTNFSDMSRLTFDIYNAQDYEASIRFYMDTDISQGSMYIMNIFTNSDYGFNTVNIIDLKPKSWNHIEILAEEIRTVKYDDKAKPYFVYGAEALEVVGGFNIEFDRGEIHEKPEVFYFDNLRAYLKK